MVNRKLYSLVLLFTCTWLATSSGLSSRAQDLEDDEPVEFAPGLVAEYRWADQSTTRLDPDLSFDWKTQPPVTQMAPASDFAVQWTGQLLARENGLFRLSLYACGRVKVSLNNSVIFAGESSQPQWHLCTPTELRFGHHDLRVEFQTVSEQPQLAMFWSGPTFGLEPISSRFFFHRPASALQPFSGAAYEQGELLARGLRCAACHEWGANQVALSAPALTHLADNLRPSWLVDRLTWSPNARQNSPSRHEFSASRMPHFGLAHNDAAAISAALVAASATSTLPTSIEPELQAANKKRPKKEPEIRTQADIHQGQIAFVSIGCLACHQVDQLGATEELQHKLFGGGDLSTLARKRTSGFIGRWLENPAQINADHRMPTFELSLLERLDLSAYLASLGAADSRNDTRAAGDIQRGVGLIERHRCGACHQLPASLVQHLSRSTLAKTRLTASSNWDAGCLTVEDSRRQVPGFALTAEHRQALRHYITSVDPVAAGLPRGSQLLAENNCLACHSRDATDGIKAHLPSIAQAVPDVAARLAAIAPPALTAVGDKYHAAALRSSIARDGAPLRPWLDIRMPKFRLNPAELTVMADYFIAHDRIPDGGPNTASELPLAQLPSDAATRLAAGRLVTAEGFGCQSCHQIGAGDPPKVDLNARGTNLAMLGQRVRPTWFHRWVRNPARIVPRMEMPAISTAVKGVLHDSLETQLAALWTTLNTPDFRPPRPSPVRIVRTHNSADLPERAWLLTDVIETPHKNYLRPLIVGLPNRQNLLFDLEAGHLATWWLGDTAHQHTRGKSWYWEPGASPLNGDVLAGDKSSTDSEPKGAESPSSNLSGPLPLEQIAVIDATGRHWRPAPDGQFAVHFDGVQHIAGGIVWHGRLHLGSHPPVKAADADNSQTDSRWLTIRQTIRAVRGGPDGASLCETELSRLQPGDRLQLTTSARSISPPATDAAGQWRVPLQGGNTLLTVGSSVRPTLVGNQTIEFPPQPSTAATPTQALSQRWSSTYASTLPTDEFPRIEMPDIESKPIAVNVVPGFAGLQLPLPPTEMPISFAWDPAGRFYAGSLKGRVLEVIDRDLDGLYDAYEVISDEIPTPFGLFADEEGVDALAKFALIRLTPPSEPGSPYDATVVADGWGYTADYHDWAIGLERDTDRNYYMALPCQQDDRSEAAAYLRGSALKLIPNASSEDPRRYRLEPISAGLRFPIGIALTPERDLFTSDNQGNYNPFNELNHLRPGKRYGFINKLENKDGFSPPFESPAINLPHPWTRSVNGICFLQTPEDLKAEQPHFGPFEGHLIGCEMNGKSLVRMSLQKVGENFQGAAYMFSRPAEAGEPNFEGPIACEVSPAGDLMIGSLQDSGWSGGQNTGSIVRLRPTGEWPLGIAEIRATPTGFEIDLTQPVDAATALKASHYQIRSYQRISTPAYGGDDQDERTERIRQLALSPDGRRVTLGLDDLREGFVYEFNIGPIGAAGQPLFPSQAHYTMRAVPME